MTVRHAQCSCGRISIRCEGDPGRRSVCHCLACQRRTGAPFGCTAWFSEAQVQAEGEPRLWTRRGDDGGEGRFRFCPNCGSTVWWTCEALPGQIAVAVGAFADPGFPPPLVSVYENRKHPWLDHFADLDLERC
ncbi:MAG: GFA family protein [Proteobacteria bacterium]|nr:GFA family protein [Pseudomonadota bacterium]